MEVSSVSPPPVQAAPPPTEQNAPATATEASLEAAQQLESGGPPPVSDADSARGELLNTSA
jgi:hypothetical protein